MTASLAIHNKDRINLIEFGDGPDSTQWTRYVTQLAQTAFNHNPIDPFDIIKNLDLWSTATSLARVLFLTEAYRAALDVPGQVMEFGVRYGRDLVLLQHLRGIYGDHNRSIVGFDTFTGHTGSSSVDGGDQFVQDGAYTVPDGYREWLERLLELHGGDVALCAGDVRVTLPAYLVERPETIVSLAVLDLDLYAPTKAVLETLVPHLVPGSVLVFDELDNRRYPGETLAVREVMPGLVLRRSAAGAAGDGMSYAVYE